MKKKLLPSNIIIDILLTIGTFGLWNIWVQIRQVSSVNELAKEKIFPSMLFIFLCTFLTFGIYFIYHEFKMTRFLHRLRWQRTYLHIELLMAFLAIPGLWFIVDSYQQNIINELASADEKVTA